jgi:hypothetical protein
MKWMMEVKQLLLQQNKYVECIDIIKAELLKGDSMIVYIHLIYVYFYMFGEPDYDRKNESIHMNELDQYYKKAYALYNENPEFLFYISFITTAYSGFYLGISDDDILKMAKKAYKMESHNLIYKWNYLQERSHIPYKLFSWSNKSWVLKTHYTIETLFNGKTLKACITTILNSQEYIDHLMKYPILGEDIIDTLKFCLGNE